MSQAVSTEGCPFCPIPPGVEILKEWNQNTSKAVVAFEPLNPVVPGHILVVPRLHYPHVGSSNTVTGYVMECVADVAALVGECNVITSKGKHATQTVFHLHVHVVPRREGDGLHLPWTGQQT